MPKYTYWTTGEIEDLKRMKIFEKLEDKEIAQIFERSPYSIEMMCKRLKIRKYEAWDIEKEEMLENLIFRTNFSKLEIARKLGRTEGAIKIKMTRKFGTENLNKLRNTFLSRAGCGYSEKENEFLKNSYYEKGVKECASILKKSRSSVVHQVINLKRKGVIFKEQTIPRFINKFIRYAIYSNKTGKIIERYESLKEWRNKKELIEIENI